MRAALRLSLIGLVVAPWHCARPGAHAQVYRGNDTGGIIPWSCENEVGRARDRRRVSARGWNKFARITSVHRMYGDYIAFNCLWRPDIARYQTPGGAHALVLLCACPRAAAASARATCATDAARARSRAAFTMAIQRRASATRCVFRRSQKSRNPPIKPRPSDQGSSFMRFTVSVLALAACAVVCRRPGFSHAPGGIVGGHDQSRRQQDAAADDAAVHRRRDRQAHERIRRRYQRRHVFQAGGPERSEPPW